MDKSQEAFLNRVAALSKHTRAELAEAWKKMIKGATEYLRKSREA